MPCWNLMLWSSQRRNGVCMEQKSDPNFCPGRGRTSCIDPKAAELAAGRRPGKKCGLAAGKNTASRQPGREKCGLAAGKNAASRQQDRKNAAKCPPKGSVT